MANLFNVIIKPVSVGSHVAVKAVIKRMLGPNTDNAAEHLLLNGGVVSPNLNEIAANNVVALLTDAGAVAEAQEIIDSAVPLFRIRLLSFGESKIRVIKVVRSFTDLGLAEVKELVEGLGIVLDNIDQPLAEKAKTALEDVGATVLIEALASNDNDQSVSTEEGYQVTGKVTLHGDHVTGVLVRAFDKDLRNEQFLGEASTTQSGEYTLFYSAEQFARSEKNNADLLLRVFNEVGVPLLLENQDGKQENIHFNAPKKAEIDLVLLETAPVKASEYERLQSLLSPALDGATLADLSLQDIDFLINETEIVEFSDQFPDGANSIHFISQSAKLVAETNLTVHAFYGWARLDVGIVIVEKQKAVDLAKLLDNTDVDNADEKLISKLKEAVEKLIIPASVLEDADSLLSQLQSLRDDLAQEVKSNWVEHQANGILVDASSAEPLDGYFIHADTEEQSNRLNSESSITNTHGEFTVRYKLSPESSTSTQTLFLQIETPNGESLDAQEISVEVDQAESITVKINVPVAPELGEELKLTALPITFSGELSAILETNNLTNIAELRKVGDLNRLEGLPDGLRGSDELKQLQAHVDLSLLSANLEPEQQIEQNEFLIKKGYNSFIDIAEIPLERFVKSLGTDASNISHPELLHSKALRSSNWVDNSYLGSLTLIGRADEPEELERNPALSCKCEDCVSAISPGAYLTDLIGYVTKHVTHEENGDPITLDFLVEKFHQPLSKLPINCEATKTQVRQVRIACEVLYKSLSPDDLAFSISNDGIKKFRENTYIVLLRNLGTSEFALQRASTKEEIESIANRLGVAVEHVETLQLQSEAHQLQETALSEHNLERIFGLPAFVKMHNDTGVPKTRLLDPLRFLNTDQTPPLFYDWQLEHLQQQWNQSDHPASPLAEGTPIIDPDIIGPDDFRNTDETTSPAFKLWKARRVWLDGEVDRIHRKIISVANKPNGIEAAISEISTPTTIDDLITQQALLAAHGKIDVGDAFDLWLKERHLSADSLVELARIATDVKANKEYTDEEWQDYTTSATNIVANSVKRAKYKDWIQEEQGSGIILDINTFWQSLTEPVEGDWSGLLKTAAPLIDPETVEPKELPNGTFGSEALTLWKARQVKLKEKQKEYSDILKSNSADRISTIMADAFGSTPDLDAINEKRNSFETNEQAEAKQSIADLSLDESSFTALLSASLILADEQQNLSDTVQNDLVAALVTAHKFNFLYENWAAEEAGLPYWKSLKARLPKWRTSLTTRQQWQQALTQASQSPLIDPDIISGDVLLEPVVGNFSFDTWRSRSKLVSEKIQNFSNSLIVSQDEVVDKTSANDLLLSNLGLTLDALLALEELENQGLSISKQLEQLILPRDAYLFLLNVAKRIDKGSKVLEATRESMVSILVQNWKVKQFSAWQEDEKSELSLSPEFFKHPKQRPIFTTPQDAQKWRVDTRRQREWYRTLKGRIEQKEVLASSLKAIVSDVEEQTLPILRNALIDIVDDTNDELHIKAERLTNRFLIGMQIGGCQVTTRVSMALEVLQNLVFSTRSGTIDIPGVEFVINSKQFEKEWKWMGSYATWKAAMGVFLYPEQVLYPTLREEQTSEFKKITSKASNKLTPKQACKIADEYYDYLSDVCSLKVKATCWGTTSKDVQQCFDRVIEASRKDLLYLFAITESMGQCYWAVYDPKSDLSAQGTILSTAQKPWWNLPVGDASIVDIVGATPYKNSIYLILKTSVDGNEILGSMTFDLESGVWSELTELSLPVGVKEYSVALVQQDTSTNAEPKPPSLVCLVKREYQKHWFYNDSGRHPTEFIYDCHYCFNTLAVDGMSWTYEDWKTLATPKSLYKDIKNISSALFYRHSILIFSNKNNGNNQVLLINELGLNTSLNKFPSTIEKLEEYHRLSAELTKFDYKIPVRAFNDDGSEKSRSQLDSEVKERNEIRNKLIEIAPDSVFNDWAENGNSTTDILHAVVGARFIPDLSSLSGIYLFHKTANTDFSYSMLRLPGQEEAFSEFRFDNDPVSLTRLEEFPGNADILSSIAVHDGQTPSLGDTGVIIYNSVLGGKNSLPGATALIVQPAENLLNKLLSRGITPKLRSQGYSTNRQQEKPIPLTGKIDDNEQIKRKSWTHVNSFPKYSNAIYIDEGYFHLPLWLALQLNRSGHYKEALDWYRLVFDFASSANRKISWVLQQEEHLDNDYEKNSAWPVQLNPHSFAQDRKNSYTQFTVQSIVRCLLDYADSEFTFDTSESVARARSLYNTAAELIESELPTQADNKCHARIEEENRSFIAKDKTLQPFYDYLKEMLGEITRTNLLNTTIEQVKSELKESNVAEQVRLFKALKHIQAAVGERKKENNFIDVFNKSIRDRLDFSRTILSGVKLPVLTTSLSNILGGISNPAISPDTNEVADFDVLDIDYMPSLSYGFCIPSNPTSRFLRLRAELNLFKIRNCMNIAGMHRELEPYAAPIDVQSALPSMGAGGQINLAGVTRIRPTLYRYPVLVDRAKQLTNLAQQTEASFFNTLQSLGQEKYTLFKARQDVELSREGVKLQKLRVKESETGVGLAELQLERTSILEENYNNWSSEDMLELEKALYEEYGRLGQNQRDVNAARVVTNYASLLVTAAAGGLSAAPAAVAAVAAFGTELVEAGMQERVIKSQTTISELSLEISVALRNREYELQHQLAEQDLEIGNQQIKLANDRVKITEQEQEISEIQSEQASDTVTFLQEKFTNVELYDWMSGVLENIFRYYLQQASSMSKLAEIQLAFERQEPLIGVIKNDYYELPNSDGNDSAGGDSSSVDRRGLTGSARLLRDITKLDQHAFQTDQRKQQLSVNFSLSQLDPFAFQQFKQTGTLNFDTPGKLFDRRFPGQYLRLIKRVKVSVIALVPPVQGISATLTSSGISRVVIKGDVFQTTTIRREPESIAFTNPIGASGVFELNPNPEMLLPFEGNGVDTRWELRLPKASNQIDFNTIADVLFTVEYTALHDRTYQEQVQGELDPYTSFDRAFSFRQEFSDAWYDLHNPEQTDKPMHVTFETALADFPSNVQNINISHILMYIVTDADLPEVFEVTLTFNNDGTAKGGLASPIENVLSTRGSANNWTSIKGLPEGKWQLELPNTSVVKQLFESEKIQDILLVLTCDGELPA